MNILFLFLSILVLIESRKVRKVPGRVQEELNREHRNAICCQKKMRCCMKPFPPPIEIRAILSRCPAMGSNAPVPLTRRLNSQPISENEHSLKSFQGFDEDEPLMQSRVTKCERKVLITLKMHHKGPISCKHQYVVVDHVYDPISQKSTRLLNPYVIKLQQEPVSKSYYLKFIDYVNSEAYEQIYNKHDGNFTGCYANTLHSTCGIVKYDGMLIPYSQGFCCSCDAKTNRDRQPESSRREKEDTVSYSDPSYLLDRVQCPRYYYKDTSYMPTGKIDRSGNTELGDKANSESQSSTGSTRTSQLVQVRQDKEMDEEVELMASTNKPENSPTSSVVTRWRYTTYSSKWRQQSQPTLLEQQVAPQQDPLLQQPQTGVEVHTDHKYLYATKRKRQDDLDERKMLHKRSLDDCKKDDLPLHVKAYLDHLTKTLGDNIFTQRLIRKIRQTYPSGMQVRGGQNCADRFTPRGLDPEHYHESAHCLRFSDVWYGIYKLGEPFVEQSISINIYERYETEGAPKWREITNGTIRLGNRNPSWEDEIPTVSIQFSSKTMNDEEDYKSLQRKRILIPEGIRECDVPKYPETRNGAEEFLVVNPMQIAIEGDQCNRIGVGFEAFFKQTDRCNVLQGTCLKNQPKHLWRQDKRKERRREKGCYFLKYHANITDDPILLNATTGEKFLDVEYSGTHSTTIDIEINADRNMVIRALSTAAITEVYVDSTCDLITLITIKIINTGLISNKFMVQLTDFPIDLPDTHYDNVKSKFALVAPQTLHIFTIEMKDVMQTELMYCTVEVLNIHKELVALRRIRIQKHDRCICTWHCLCACVASSLGLKCNPMSLEHYHAAGFLGALPIVTYIVHFTLLEDLLSVVIYFAVFLLGILLVMGLAKALVGLCWAAIGIWGLDIILLPRKIRHYYEPSIRHRRVVYDCVGNPVHPDSGRRVRHISETTQFFTNIVFFFTYPLACCMLILRRLCCSYYTSMSGRKKKKPDCKAPSCTTSASASPSRTTSNTTTSKAKHKSDGGKKKKGKSRSHTSKDSKTSGSSKKGGKCKCKKPKPKKSSSPDDKKKKKKAKFDASSDSKSTKTSKSSRDSKKSRGRSKERKDGKNKRASDSSRSRKSGSSGKKGSSKDGASTTTINKTESCATYMVTETRTLDDFHHKRKRSGSRPNSM